jgi:hypothetical protein
MKIWDYKSNDEDKLSKKVEKDNDIVFTKPEMAKYLISLIKFQDGDIVMEPCKGKGAFYDNIPNNVVKKYCEINEDIDYLKFDDIVDITLSNPPFIPRKLFWDFHVKAMDTTNKNIYWLINILSLNIFTPKRLNIMKDRKWFIQSFNVVSDKRWFGRYVWVKFGREDNGIFSWFDKSF